MGYQGGKRTGPDWTNTDGRGMVRIPRTTNPANHGVRRQGRKLPPGGQGEGGTRSADPVS